MFCKDYRGGVEGGDYKVKLLGIQPKGSKSSQGSPRKIPNVEIEIGLRRFALGQIERRPTLAPFPGLFFLAPVGAWGLTFGEGERAWLEGRSS